MIWGQIIYSVSNCEQHLEVHGRKSTPTDYPIPIISSDYVCMHIVYNAIYTYALCMQYQLIKLEPVNLKENKERYRRRLGWQMKRRNM